MFESSVIGRGSELIRLNKMTVLPHDVGPVILPLVAHGITSAAAKRWITSPGFPQGCEVRKRTSRFPAAETIRKQCRLFKFFGCFLLELFCRQIGSRSCYYLHRVALRSLADGSANSLSHQTPDVPKLAMQEFANAKYRLSVRWVTFFENLICTASQQRIVPGLSPAPAQAALCVFVT
jgi:hypothetical protein